MYAKFSELVLCLMTEENISLLSQKSHQSVSIKMTHLRNQKCLFRNQIKKSVSCLFA
jgi:hypothetical protein